MFVLTNLLIKSKKTAPTSDGFLGCFAIAIALMAMIILSCTHSGGCLNPAVGLAMTSWHMINYGTMKGNAFRYMWLYFFAPMFGAIWASMFHSMHISSLNSINEKKTADDKNGCKLLEE